MLLFLWLLTIGSTLLGGVIFCFGLATANGAPQQAAAASIALGLAVGPYVLARAASEIAALEKESRQAAKAMLEANQAAKVAAAKTAG